MVAEQFRNLFSPIPFGHKTAKNRIVVTPHGASYGEAGRPNERYIRYLAEKAKNGVGVVMMFGSSAIHMTTQVGWGEVNNIDDSIIPYLESVADAIHQYDAICVSQISHRGRRGNSPYTGYPLWSASDTWEEPHRDTPHIMTKREIREIIDAYAAAALRLKKAGFDGADIPMYGGHLLENFLSPLSNTRSDEYGGSVENRLRISIEVFDTVREAVGSDFIVGTRLSGDHYIDGGLTHEDLKDIAARLNARRFLDYFIISGAVPETYKLQGMVTPSLYYPLGVFNGLSASMKEVIDVPVIVAGRIVSPVQAEEVLVNGWADMVGLNRALLADHEMPIKAREGRVDDIRLCTGAAEGCIGRLRLGKPITCVQNPVIGREAELAEILPAAQARRVVIAGGGVAGLEAARVAKLRGHDVVLFDKSTVLGGQVVTLSRAPHRSSWEQTVSWLKGQIKKLNVDVRLREEATAAKILAEQPDAVVIATGSVPRRPNIPGAQGPNVYDSNEVLNGVLDGKVQAGQRVVVVDEEGFMRGPSAAEYLQDRGAQVEIVTRFETVAVDVDENLRFDVHANLLKKGAVYTTLTRATAVEPEGVRVRHLYSGEERAIPADIVVFAFMARAHDHLFHELDGKVPALQLVGDALAPRRMHDAILDGTRAARAIN